MRIERASHFVKAEGIKLMLNHRFARSHNYFSIFLLSLVMLGTTFVIHAQTQRGPSDTVREFYKAMREHRFKEAWSLTIYKSAVETLTAEEMEDLRPDFEDRAAKIPEQVEITGEQINGNTATVFVKVPNDSEAQVVSEPVTLISAGGIWIIGDEANEAVVKKAGRRYFLDAMIETHESDIEDFLKRLIAIEILYSQHHEGVFGDLKALIDAGLTSHDVADAASTGYHFHIVVARDGKSYVAGAEPARYGHTGKASFWMDQTGNLKKSDNGGKPLSAPK